MILTEKQARKLIEGIMTLNELAEDPLTTPGEWFGLKETHRLLVGLLVRESQLDFDLSECAQRQEPPPLLWYNLP